MKSLYQQSKEIARHWFKHRLDRSQISKGEKDYLEVRRDRGGDMEKRYRGGKTLSDYHKNRGMVQR